MVNYDPHTGCRLTDCCGAYSTFVEGDLCCKHCYEEVGYGEGDGSEHLDVREKHRNDVGLKEEL